MSVSQEETLLHAPTASPAKVERLIPVEKPTNAFLNDPAKSRFRLPKKGNFRPNRAKWPRAQVVAVSAKLLKIEPRATVRSLIAYGCQWVEASLSTPFFASK